MLYFYCVLLVLCCVLFVLCCGSFELFDVSEGVFVWQREAEGDWCVVMICFESEFVLIDVVGLFGKALLGFMF